MDKQQPQQNQPQQQLLMYWKRQEVPEVSLPQGFSIRKFDTMNYEKDVETWLEICRNGLIPEDGQRDYFTTIIEKYPDLELDNLFFILRGDKPVATVVPVIHPLSNGAKRGYVHMVCALPEIRGLGIGNQLNRIAMRIIYDAGCKDATLTTDDFRIAAIKSYISIGFLPVLSDSTMEERWLAVMDKLSIGALKVYSADYQELQTLVIS